MDRIAAARVFIEIVESGSFSKAAERLGMSRAMATRYLSELEAWSGSQLMQRSTRRLSLTEAGDHCLRQCVSLLEIALEIESSSQSPHTVPKGKVKVAASVSFAQAVLTPLIAEFLKLHPQISVELIAEDRTVNLIESRADLAIRISSGLDPGLIAKKMGTCRSVICATPAYLKEFGSPKTIEDLAKHNCLIHSYVSKAEWVFKKKSIEKSVQVSGSFSSNEATVLLKAVLSNVGLSMLPVYLVHELIEEGTLTPLFEEWPVRELGIYGVYTSKKHQLPATRFLLEFLTTRLQNVTT